MDEAQAAHEGTRLLLVVDGDVASSLHSSILLQRLEYNVYAAKTAEDALDVMSMTAPSLILTDTALPRMSGLDLLRHVKESALFASIPVIIYADNHLPGHEELCRRAGCADFLAKPADPTKLYAAIQSATEPNPRRVIRLRTRLCMNVEEEAEVAGAANDGCITYLSEGGLYISTEEPLSPGTALPVVFSPRNVTIRAEGIVLYSFSKNNKPAGEPGMGLKFLNISSSDKELIRLFIMERLTKNIAPL